MQRINKVDEKKKMTDTTDSLGLFQFIWFESSNGISPSFVMIYDSGVWPTKMKKTYCESVFTDLLFNSGLEELLDY